MPWYKVTLTHDQNIDGTLLADIHNEFSSLMKKRIVPRSVGVFPMKKSNADYSFSVYFSPECINYCPQLIEKYHGVECAKPDSADVGFSLGHPDTCRLL